mmetsp:Transcript_3674/g.7428  ORF Transcript_3674/g.7428 Transcript_3674/m.7428 type:complete len:80 (+) Transcript_3674:1040-1279(+)
MFFVLWIILIIFFLSKKNFLFEDSLFSSVSVIKFFFVQPISLEIFPNIEYFRPGASFKTLKAEGITIFFIFQKAKGTPS